MSCRLKCNRATPCDQCEKRGIQRSCVYVPYLFPRTPLRSTPASVRATKSTAGGENSLREQNRQLRELVQALRTELGRRGGPPGSSDGGGPPGSRKGSAETPADLSGVAEPTPAGTLVNDLRYVDNANWEAVSDDVLGRLIRMSRNKKD